MRARFKFSYGQNPAQIVSVVAAHDDKAGAETKAQAAIRARYARTTKPIPENATVLVTLLSVAKLPIGARK